MKMVNKVFLILVLYSVAFINPVYSYIDPGTGSFIVQILIAGFLGGVYAVKSFWKEIKNFFVKNKK